MSPWVYLAVFIAVDVVAVAAWLWYRSRHVDVDKVEALTGMLLFSLEMGEDTRILALLNMFGFFGSGNVINALRELEILHMVSYEKKIVDGSEQAVYNVTGRGREYLSEWLRRCGYYTDEI